MPQYQDMYGNILRIGDEVAFNRSGNVVKGLILNIEWHKKYGNKRPIFYIYCALYDSVSKVTSSKSILKLGAY